MSRHTVSRRNKTIKTVALLILALSLVVGAVAYAWVDSLDRNIHKNSGIIDKAVRALKPSPKNYGDPINILVLGSDKRYNVQGDTGRSDTLMIMRVDFKKNRVYLISIPRDSRVSIPGRGMDKINAAYAYGGPPLSIRTVQSFTGMDLNHYIEVDFNGFKKLVDTLGGVDVNVQETINNRTRGYSMYIPKGPQHMDGTLALNYVRYRHGDDDFKRAGRQQNFLRALASNALKWQSLWKLPKLINILSQNVETEMSMRQMSDLASFLRNVKEKDIETITVPGSTGMQNGVSYVYPNEAAVSDIVDAVEKGQSLKSLKSQLESGKMPLSNKDISVRVLNGSGVNGLALSTREKLIGSGFDVVGVGTAPNSGYLVTQVLATASNADKALRIKRLLSKSAQIKISPEKLSADVQVIVGKDYISSKAGN